MTKATEKDEKPAGKKAPSAGSVGSRKAILEGSLLPTLLALGWPMFGALMLATFERHVGIFWVGRLVGTQGLEVIGLIGPFAGLMAMLFGAFFLGLRPLISQSVGRDDGKAPQLMITTAYALLTVAMAIVIVSYWKLDELADFLAGESGAAPEIKRYLVPLLLFLPVPLMAQISEVAVSATGWTRFGLARNAISITFGALVLPLFIGVFGLGTPGVAWSEGTSDLLLLILTAVAIWRFRDQLGIGTFDRAAFKPSLNVLRRVLGIGLLPQLSRSLFVATQLVYVQLLTWDDNNGVAAYLVAMVLTELFSHLVLGFHSASGIMISQNAAADKGSRARRTLTLVLVGSVLFGLLVNGLYYLGLLDWTIRILVPDDQEVFAGAKIFLAAWLFCLPFILIARALMTAYQSVGNTKMAGSLEGGIALIALAVAILYPGTARQAVIASLITFSVVRALAFVSSFSRAFLSELRDGPQGAVEDSAS